MPDYIKEFNTKLTDEEERRFQEWAARQSQAAGRDVLMDLQDYDLRGQWKLENAPDFKRGQHGPDRFKKPNHPTFSDESIYSTAKTPGGKWVQMPDGGYEYHPSAAMLSSTHKNLDRMRQYFYNYEPDVTLVLPDGSRFKRPTPSQLQSLGRTK